MSGQEANMSTTKKFGGGERSVPHSSQKASKFYPTEDVKVNRKTRKAIRPAKTRASITPGTVVILLAGRFRGKRTIVLKHLDQGVLLVTGPFVCNGCPLRRVNARYVIATSTKVDISSVDEKILEKVSKPEYFAREKSGKSGKGEEAFFKQGEKPEAKKPTSERAADQKTIDKALLATIKKEEFLASYLNSSFSLRHGQKPHEMKF